MAGTEAAQLESAAVDAPVPSGPTAVPTPRMPHARPGFWRAGEPLVWASGAALAAMLLLLVTLLAVIAVNGLGVFWPAAIEQLQLADGSVLVGQRIRSEVNPDNGVRSVQFKTANREFAPGRQDFQWIDATKIRRVDRPAGILVLERLENGDFYGFLRDVRTPTLKVSDTGSLADRLAVGIRELDRRRAREVQPISDQVMALSEQLQGIREAMLRIQYRQKHDDSATGRASASDTLHRLRSQDEALKAQSQQMVERQQAVETQLARNVAVMTDAQGHERIIPLASVVRWYAPNAMSLPAKIGHYVEKIGELLSGAPRESNTEGGLFPAIFGTLMLMFLMAVGSFPLGVLAGIYLGEYARDGLLVRIVRIAVNNLAGIPSIVYGIFGLGFFVYGLGGFLDHWLYPERAEAGIPTFGTGGILWASMTLGLLTMPVVIVSTEEALRAIPRGLREASLAMGATKFQTLLRVLLPMASPGIMTGFILAMARAAGEVAPLMITGVVKLAPSLPLDGQFPFFHLDRKFMHLGFHIYDIGFQSPNVEAAKPMVYVTTLLLVLLVLLMSSVAIVLRNRMRRTTQLRAM
jgi:phosphate transport system permease protein